MKIVLSPGAEKRLAKLPRLGQVAVGRKIRSLEGIVFAQEKLKGYKDVFRVRVGDYRVVYQKTREQIYVVLIGHRKDVYRLFKHLFE